MATGETFRLDIEAWRKKVGANLEAVARQSIQVLSSNVIEATPLDTGFLSSMWQPSLGAASMLPSGSVKTPSGSAQKYGMSQIVTVVTGMKMGDTFFLTNNTVYARRIEYGFVGADSLGREYNQPGRFFLQKQIKQWRRIVTKVVAELDK